MRELQVGRHVGAGRLNVSTLLLEHPVFGAVCGLTGPDSLMFKDIQIQSDATAVPKYTSSIKSLIKRYQIDKINQD